MLIQLTTPLSQNCLPGRVTQMEIIVTSGIWSFTQGWQRVPMFGQPETENLFLKRSDVIYHNNNKKNPSPEIGEFI